ncbi:MAG: DVUA0089 family protein [Candidatus Omnitrophota bacterium]|jgi:hypothetical protein
MRKIITMLILSAILSIGTLAEASDYSFEGLFTQDDTVQFFNFSIGEATTVTVKTYSFTGGINAAGNPILGGGFDPILAIFSGTYSGGFSNTESLKALYTTHNDDTNISDPGPFDPVTGESWDSYVNVNLGPGNYTAALVQYGNFYKSGGSSEFDPVFTQLGNGNYTAADNGSMEISPFWISDDDIGLGATKRDGHWAVDILKVDNAGVGDTLVTPEPISSALFLLGGGVLAARRFRKSKKS